jgi:hypothetical protein
VSSATTPAARALLAEVEAEAAKWDAIAMDPDDQNSFVRHGARARRDALDWAVARLKVALPTIEDEAVEADRVDVERLMAALETVGDGWAEAA